MGPLQASLQVGERRRRRPPRRRPHQPLAVRGVGMARLGRQVQAVAAVLQRFGSEIDDILARSLGLGIPVGKGKEEEEKG